MRFIDTRNGEIIRAEDVGPLVESRYTEEMYEDFLNELGDSVEICGCGYSEGTALRRVDPVRFECGLHEEQAYIESDIVDNGESHPEVNIEVIE